MIKSMTGYGSAKGFSGKTEISVELRSVNSRYLDCSIKLPRMYTAFEDSLKSAVGKHISRGKVDVYITIDMSKAGDVEIKVNKPLAQAYVSALKAMSKEYKLLYDLRVIDLARFPEVLLAEKTETDPEQLCADVCSVLEQALSGFDNMRINEGKTLYHDIKARLGEIEKLTDQAQEASPRSVAEYRAKLEARMQDVLQTAGIDEQRILTEAAIFADRVAINEETVRLRSHISQLRAMLDSDEAVGRKIDFLVQEFNREANTIGSKGNDAEIARITVEMKSEIEKIREQAQNIE